MSKRRTMNTMTAKMIIEDHLLNQKEEKKIMKKILKTISLLQTSKKKIKTKIKIDCFSSLIV